MNLSEFKQASVELPATLRILLPNNDYLIPVNGLQEESDGIVLISNSNKPAMNLQHFLQASNTYDHSLALLTNNQKIVFGFRVIDHAIILY